MLEIYRKAGKMALGSRLRQLSETLAEQAANVYQLYGVDVDPKWFPVFYMLNDRGCLSVSALAEAVGHSHASVSKIVKEMTVAGISSSEKVAGDGRVNLVCLTPKGKQVLARFQSQSEDMAAVVEELLMQSQHNLWEAVTEVEYLLAEKDLYSRIKEKFTAREKANIELVDFTPRYASAFRDLNYDWIEKYFTVEESDRAMLEAPQEYILDGGGYILMALYQNEPVGTCALIKHGDSRFELAKMAVSDQAKGKGIGYLMGASVLKKAQELGARLVFLESNTQLTPAITLYKKLGFVKVIGKPSPYARCNIQMEIAFHPSV